MVTSTTWLVDHQGRPSTPLWCNCNYNYLLLLMFTGSTSGCAASLHVNSLFSFSMLQNIWRSRDGVKQSSGRFNPIWILQTNNTSYSTLYGKKYSIVHLPGSSKSFVTILCFVMFLNPCNQWRVQGERSKSIHYVYHVITYWVTD